MNVPRLRFKDEAEQDFPEWKEKLLGNLCSTFKSGRRSKKIPKGERKGDILITTASPTFKVNY